VPSPASPPSRIRIEKPQPSVDCGRYPPKRVAGDLVEVSADIFRDGHEMLRAVIRWRGPRKRRWQEASMHPTDAHENGVRWARAIAVDAPGCWEWTIEAWVDELASWRDEVQRKLTAGQRELTGELAEGIVLLRGASSRARASERRVIEAALATLEDEAALPETKHDVALGTELAAAADRTPDRSRASTLDAPLRIDVDPPLARFGTWYEVFPRSWGGFEGLHAKLEEFAALGIDVLYLTPIHPIGTTNRKGANNEPIADPGDPGSPWAIGGPEGGHEAILPDLGSVEDFERLVADARAHGVEIALDFAIHCSADHPWLREHPEWFYQRPDGTLRYAENPPKRYQDIYNLDFECSEWRALWDALREIVRLWIARGVRVFRVDNPHTKPFAFWEWLLSDVRERNPEVIFLAEAFTRRAVMRELAKLGFDQSYTYFTWKNSRWELSEYIGELAYGEEREYFRPNMFTNTPDILSEYLQHGGRPAFEARMVLAATLSPSYGIYSGFEHCENTPVRPGSEEYLDSEKYEIKQRDLDGPLLGLFATLNAIRRDQPALQRFENVTFLDTANDSLIAYAKGTGADLVLTVVNIDFRHAQEGLLVLGSEFGLPDAFDVVDLLDGARYEWRSRGPGNFIRLLPDERVAHVIAVERQ
jgi:starch synthase (maltosyl-transferring)